MHDNQPVGDFVGYDGLENHGGLSNLLETEWLLRELDPDDFVRRLAEGEVLFRKRNFQDAGKRNTLAAILDCGEERDIFERLYAVRLDRIRELQECRDLVEPLDHQHLLTGSAATLPSDADELDDDALLAELGICLLYTSPSPRD